MSTKKEPAEPNRVMRSHRFTRRTIALLEALQANARRKPGEHKMTATEIIEMLIEMEAKAQKIKL